MGHGITSTDSLFSVRTTPWHKLGAVLGEYPTRQQAQQIAHPWEVVQEPIYRMVPVIHTHTEDCYGRCNYASGELVETYELIEGFTANVRSDDAGTLGIVTDSFEPVTNGTLYDIAEAIEGEGKGEVMFETAGSLNGGAKVWVLVRLREPLIVPGDPHGGVIPYYALQNAHDGSASLRGQSTLTRIVCHAVGTPVLHNGQWIKVEDHPGVMAIKDEDGLRVSIAGLPAQMAETVTLDHQYWARTPDSDPTWVQARNLTSEHQIGYPIPAGSDARLVPPEFVDDTEDFWWAVGLFWGDGNLVGSRQVCWSISDPVLLERMMGFLTRHGFTGKGSQRPGVRQITWANKTFHDFVAPLYRGEGRGKGKRSKVPPAEWEAVSLEELAALTEGYYDADGSEDTSRGGRIWASSELGGLLSLRRMLLRLGHPSLLRNGRAWEGTSEIQAARCRSRGRTPSVRLQVPRSSKSRATGHGVPSLSLNGPGSTPSCRLTCRNRITPTRLTLVCRTTVPTRPRQLTWTPRCGARSSSSTIRRT